MSTAKVRKCAEPEVVVLQLALAGVGREEFSVSHTMQCAIALKTLWKRNRLGSCGPLL